MTDGNGTHASLWEAVRAVQALVGTLPKDKLNPHYQSRYTPLDTIVEVVGPLLAEHGLVWTTYPTVNVEGQPALRYRLTHAPTGEHVEDKMPLLVTHVSPQGMGSAITYARRYSLCSVLNLVADEDDDGQAAKPKKAVRAKGVEKGADDKQRRQIQALIKELGVTRAELASIVGPMRVELQEGWMDQLTPGKEGSAQVLIDLLVKRRDYGKEPPTARDE